MNDISLFDDIPNFLTVSKEQVKKIVSRLPEYKKGKAMIGHSTSQSSYSLQTMNMINDSPLSRMKQCLAQIDKKYTALQEAYFKIEKKKLLVKNIQFNKDDLSKIKMKQYNSEIENISVLMESALREIGLFQNMYDSIKKNNNIPDNWSEKDYEKQEIEHMIRSAFRLAIQNIQSNGRLTQAEIEYFEQLGIHPQQGEFEVRKYIQETNNILNKIGEITIQLMYDFLDSMVKKYSDSHKLALKRIGLNELGSEEFMAKGYTKPT